MELTSAQSQGEKLAELTGAEAWSREAVTASVEDRHAAGISWNAHRGSEGGVEEAYFASVRLRWVPSGRSIQPWTCPDS